MVPERTGADRGGNGYASNAPLAEGGLSLRSVIKASRIYRNGGHL